MCAVVYNAVHVQLRCDVRLVSWYDLSTYIETVELWYATLGNELRDRRISKNLSVALYNMGALATPTARSSI